MLEVTEFWELLLDWKGWKEWLMHGENGKDGCRSSDFHCTIGLLWGIHTNYLLYLVPLTVRVSACMLHKIYEDGAVKMRNGKVHINSYRREKDIFHLGCVLQNVCGTEILNETVYLLFKDTYRKVTFINDAYIYKCAHLKCINQIWEVWKIKILLSLWPDCFPAQKQCAVNVMNCTMPSLSHSLFVLEGSKGISHLQWSSADSSSEPCTSLLAQVTNWSEQWLFSFLSVGVGSGSSTINLYQNQIRFSWFKSENHSPLLEVCAMNYVPLHSCIPPYEESQILISYCLYFMVKSSLISCGITMWKRQKIILQVFCSFCKPNPHNGSCCRPISRKHTDKLKILMCLTANSRGDPWSYRFQVMMEMTIFCWSN